MHLQQVLETLLMCILILDRLFCFTSVSVFEVELDLAVGLVIPPH